MRAVDLIRKKREGDALKGDEFAWLVRGLSDGQVPLYQWSALLMAILWRGMNAEEVAALTDAMLRSGTIVDLSSIEGPKIDKHSTGGVGDKTSLILAPIVAACGVSVPMVSGRGLGHTGGTLDKLESIPGFRVDLDLDRYRAVLKDCGLVLIGQTADIAPADRALYALRDATATVESIPLISASIMSKKLAEGIDGLVLDVKAGDGAFMRREDDARTLAKTMREIGRSFGLKVSALITHMDQPLGQEVGNALEVAESIRCLQGRGPQDLMMLSVELAAEMLVLAEAAESLSEARADCREAIANGSALESFRRVVKLQGGDPRVIDDLGRLPQARYHVPVVAESDGFVQRLSARAIGHASMRLGAGRERIDSKIDPAVGLTLHKKVGDAVHSGETLASIHANHEGIVSEVIGPAIVAAYRIGGEPVEPIDLILDRL